MPVLYLVEQGATLRKKGDTLTVTKNESDLQVIPASKVDQVVIFGNVNITTPVIHYLLDEGKDCVFCSSTGRYHGRLFSTESKYGLLRRAQFEALADGKIQLAIAIEMVRGKLTNQRIFLQRYQRKAPDDVLGGVIDNMESLLCKLDGADDIGTLLGLEGYASSMYFNAFKTVLKQNLGFTRRRRRPPPDPVNSLLSFGYTLLVYDAQAAVRIVGLDPFLGFLHSTEYSKPSLALDLMEEFRTVVIDSIVLRLINNNIMGENDFSKDVDTKGMIRLKDESLRTFIRYYEERMTDEVIHPVFNTRVTYRRCLELQARQVARVVTKKQEKYHPFLVK
ncbi:CRISPR-associated endonuclease Cas1 [Chloroflexota bacterium]